MNETLDGGSVAQES